MKRALAAAVMIAALAACGGGAETGSGGGAETGSEEAGKEKVKDGSMDAMHHGDEKASCDVTEGTMKIVAKNSRFDLDCMAARAGQPFKIEMDNQDDLQHNVAIHRGDKSVFRGEIVGKGQTTYDVPAVPAGTYGFHCDVHPDMKGTFKATA
ncbi:MAG: cupredoxin domain-containing protein [Actinomycetota bacterium]